MNDRAKEIFKKLCNVCGLSGILVEAPYKKRVPGQCHRCQMYGHAAANCYAQPRCVKCLVPHWTKDCERSKESGGKPSCCNCGQDHTANYGGCPEAPKPEPFVAKKVNSPNKLKDSTAKSSQVRPLNKSTNKTVRMDKDMPSSAGGKEYGPVPPRVDNSWNKSLPWVRPRHAKETIIKESLKKSLHNKESVTSTLGEDISTIMSILQVVRSSEVADLAAKFRKARHGVDRLRIILEKPGINK
ncbi:Nucleic-acid-binding protein from transposon X-element [Eumeta japonica]|uniref:Nucleic-acid-binding protein from transposon X-element n=1 Tax=Eumeta variegata TaxID=151549 RepID=A0A4C1SSJ5_EUMVA|nr:Nucleic-acid-binding protein from transposon X-element [Eumeta japonica]